MCSVGSQDVHPNGLNMQAPPRVDLFKKFVMDWLGHPCGKIFNMIRDSGDLI